MSLSEKTYKDIEKELSLSKEELEIVEDGVEDNIYFIYFSGDCWDNYYFGNLEEVYNAVQTKLEADWNEETSLQIYNIKEEKFVKLKIKEMEFI